MSVSCVMLKNAHHCSKRVGDEDVGGVANLELDGLSVRRYLNIGINS